MKYILRIIVAPFYLAIYLICSLYSVLGDTVLYIRYGGEMFAYRKDDRSTIHNIYEKLKYQSEGLDKEVVDEWLDKVNQGEEARKWRYVQYLQEKLSGITGETYVGVCLRVDERILELQGLLEGWAYNDYETWCRINYKQDG